VIKKKLSETNFFANEATATNQPSSISSNSNHRTPTTAAITNHKYGASSMETAADQERFAVTGGDSLIKHN
jgi:hypothetical protein